MERGFHQGAPEPEAMNSPVETTHTLQPGVLPRLDAWIGRHARTMAATLYVVALVLRLVHLFAYRNSLLAHVLLMDEAYYHAEAWNLVRGVPQPSDSWFMTPLYPYFLSLVFRFTGESATAAYAVQMGLGAASAPLAFVVARRVMSNAWAFVTGVAVASFAPVIFFEALFLVEWLILLAWLAATALAVRRPQGRVHATLAGVLLGLATLGRGSNALLLVPFALWFGWRNRSSVPSAALLAHPAVRQVARFAAGWALVLFPLFVFNATHAQQPVLLTANAGFNLYLGNGPNATGIFRLPDGIDLAQDPLALRYVQRQTGRHVTASEASRFWARETWEWVREHPGSTLRLFVWKLVLFWNRFAIPQVESFASVAALYPLGHAPYWRLYWIFPLGLSGAVVAFASAARSAASRRRATAPSCGAPHDAGGLLASGVAFYALSIALFFVTDRYRIAAMPQLIVLSMYACSRIVSHLRSARRASAAGIVVLISLATLATDPELLAVDRARVQRDLLVHDALRFAKAGAFDAAVEAYEAALVGAPGDPDLRDGAARLYARAGNESLAIATFQDLLRDQESARSWYNLGNVYRRGKRHREAVRAYRRALELEPRREAAWNNLGEAYRALGDTAAAAEAYRQAIAIVPGHEQALNNLGALRASQGDAPAAEARFRAAVRANPRYVPAWTNLALLLAGTGRERQAADTWRMIRRLDPENAVAKQALDTAVEAGLIEAEER
jgi:Flp pilus assembly protein TadD